jgi:hypothetical protein
VPDGAGWRVEEAAYSRTARRIMEGDAFVRRSRLEVSRMDAAMEGAK